MNENNQDNPPRQWSALVAIPAAMLGIALFFVVVDRNPQGPTLFGGAGEVGNEDEALPYFRWGLSLVLTFIGVMLAAVYREASGRKGAIKKWSSFFGAAFRSPGFIAGMAAAPFAFALLLPNAAELTLPSLILLSLENGFAATSAVEVIIAPKPAAT